MAAGGYQARIVRRLVTSYDGLLSRHSPVFRQLRMEQTAHAGLRSTSPHLLLNCWFVVLYGPPGDSDADALQGFIGDFAASIVYVPSEVLKTRLQLQGRFNNPYFKSGYNYRGAFDAARTIVRTEGFSELFSGYKATLYRDLPFSALQFMFYEQFQSWAREWKESREIGVRLELLTGAAGGGLAGVLTCPLDVVKTRLQTQVDAVQILHKPKDRTAVDTKAAIKEPPARQATGASPSTSQIRPISTSSPSTSLPRPGAIPLDEDSIFRGLRLIYKTEGVGGWFRGVGPRFVWTSVQSSCMFFLYQTVLRQFETWRPIERQEMSR